MDRSFFRRVTMHAFDRKTDGQTAFSSLDGVAKTSSGLETCTVRLTAHCISSCSGIASVQISDQTHTLYQDQRMSLRLIYWTGKKIC